MLGRHVHNSRLFFCSNPDGSGASGQRERIVSNDFRGTFEAQHDGIVRIGTNRAEFVRNTEDDARGIGTIGAKPET
jgi:hypothetical protein